MAAAVRYKWMFRTAAALAVLLGCGWLYTALFTDYRPQHRPWVLSLGLVSVAIGVMLFLRWRVAIGLSALGAGIVCLSATVFAPQAHGPGILFLAALAIFTGVYVALALRVLFERVSETSGG